MKIYKLTILSIVFVLISTVRCSDEFLEVEPANALSIGELANKKGIEKTLIGAYSILLGREGFYSDASNWFWGSVVGGEANKGSNAGDQSQMNEVQSYSVQATNAAINEKYTRAYEGVARSNFTLKLIDAAAENLSEVDRIRLSGEARFLRGHYYFDLKKNFNDVPYVDETWDEITPVPNNQNIWPMIEADFRFAYENLEGTMAQAGRANKWAAGAYLGKSLVFQGKYAEAITVLTDVINNGTTASGEKYGLMENYAHAFWAQFDNNKESVFAAQAATGTGSINNANPSMVLNFPHGGGLPSRPGECCGFFQPSLSLANSFRTDNGLPLLDNSFNSTENAVKHDLGLFSSENFTPDTGPLDPRIDHSIGRRGIPYLDWGNHPGRSWIREQPYGGPYSPKKFVYYSAGKDGTENDLSSWTPGYTTVNYSIIRFADVLLLAAEAEIEAGSLEKAREYINLVRERASNSLVTRPDGAPAANYNISLYSSFPDKEYARTALRFERKLELSGEGHRFYDLVRWGIADEVLNDYLEYENQFLRSPFSGATFTSGKNEYFPIPQSEIDLQGSDVLSQNDGY